jgi:hypothetical protein
MAPTAEEHWIATRLAATEPGWRPDPLRARQRIDEGCLVRPAHRHRRVRVALAAAVAVVAAVFVAPTGRVLAQELWYRLFASRFQVVRLDLSKVPLDTSLSVRGAEQSAASIEDASALAGYTVALPPADVLPGVPVLGVLPPIAISHRIDRARLVAGLAAIGADDVEVPVGWDGVTLRGTVGRTVSARYLGSGAVGRVPDDVTILQTPPIRLDVPSGFALDRFAEAMFRAGGLSWWDARTLGQEYAAHPAWLLDVPEAGAVTVETVPLAGGTAVVVDETGDGRRGEVTVFVSRPWRLYAVSSPSREKSLRVAAALR